MTYLQSSKVSSIYYSIHGRPLCCCRPVDGSTTSYLFLALTGSRFWYIICSLPLLTMLEPRTAELDYLRKRSCSVYVFEKGRARLEIYIHCKEEMYGYNFGQSTQWTSSRATVLEKRVVYAFNCTHQFFTIQTTVMTVIGAGATSRKLDKARIKFGLTWSYLGMHLRPFYSVREM